MNLQRLTKFKLLMERLRPGCTAAVPESDDAAGSRPVVESSAAPSRPKRQRGAYSQRWLHLHASRLTNPLPSSPRTFQSALSWRQTAQIRYVDKAHIAAVQVSVPSCGTSHGSDRPGSTLAWHASRGRRARCKRPQLARDLITSKSRFEL